MWHTSVTDLLGIRVPVIQAPMAGGPSTAALASAVSEAGGLGSIAGGYLSPGRLRDEIRAVREATRQPFAVNLFVPTEAACSADELVHAARLVEPYRLELGLPARAELHQWAPDFDAQLSVVLEENVGIVSFTFGLLPASAVDALDGAGVVMIGTATSVAEAEALVGAGAHLVCAQGSEAGGHRGGFLDGSGALVGTMALIPQVCDSISVPVIAAGGIMDARGVAAALALGAGAAQLGTAFLLTSEAGTAPPHRRAVVAATEASVALTSKVSGRTARGVANRLMRELELTSVPAYPVMNALTSELRRRAGELGDPELMSLWCGQAPRLARSSPAAEIVLSIDRHIVGVVEAVARLRDAG